MEDWKMWALLALNLVAWTWNLVAAIRRDRKAARLDQAALGAGLLPSADRLAPLSGSADDEAARRETTEWLAQAMNKMRARDQAAQAELRSRVEVVTKESAAAVLPEARLQLAEEIAPLLQAIQKKAHDLQALQPAPAGVQGLIADVRALSEAISKRP
ncbi:MAG: hypothetical protein LBO00_10250 [Zoogloeaceae bacterium]|jgi:hypothetical protein|nr:hypothetical protein [Zoogloeaceae bacterium]